LPRLESSLIHFHGSLNVDLRQTAQRIRSGLQFLLDELEGEAAHQDLQPLLTSDPVKCIEEYIDNTKDIPPEFSIPEPQDLSEIPPSHFWWKEGEVECEN